MSNLPSVAEALEEWGDKVKFTKTIKAIVDGDLTEKASRVLEFYGVLQPMPIQELFIKPEAQRKWKFWKFWTDQVLVLDDVIEDDQGISFRVMEVSTWGSYNTYDLREGPTT